MNRTGHSGRALAGHDASMLLALPPSGMPNAATLFTELQRMGLRPTRVGEAGPLLYAIQLGGSGARLSLPTAEQLRYAAPADPNTAMLGNPASPDITTHPILAVTLQSAKLMPGAPVADRWRAMQDAMTLLAVLTDLLHPTHVFWTPARLWSEAAYFRSAAAEMLASGMLPVLHLVAFRQDLDGGVTILRTRGLAFFAGQELHMALAPGDQLGAMVRGMARIALDIIMHGPMMQPDRFDGPDGQDVWTVTPAGAANLWIAVEPKR